MLGASLIARYRIRRALKRGARAYIAWKHDTRKMMEATQAQYGHRTKGDRRAIYAQMADGKRVPVHPPRYF